MTTISPDPTSLGFSSVRLKQWFDGDTDVRLGAPDPADLSVQVPENRRWLPPANGTLTLTRTDVDGSGTAHRHLIGLRNVSGDPAFGPVPDQLVAVFTLFPLVHRRLQQLVAAVTTGPLSSLSRAVPNRWALRLPFPADLDALRTLVDDSAAGLADLGFNSDLRPLSRPMTAGRRTTLDTRETLIAIPTGATAHLHCFDELGLPLDPGAVAAMFNALITEYDNLGETEDLHLAPDTGRRIHLVGPAGAPIDTGALGALLLAGSAPDAALATVGAGDQQVSVADASSRPHLRVSTLPAGTRAATVALADISMMTRDLIRIGVVDYADRLTGTDRSSAEQQRASTRIDVAPTADTPTLLASADEVLGAMTEALGAAGRGDAVASLGAFDGAIGPFPAPPTLPDVAPDSFDGVEIHPLHGGAGPEEGDWSPKMRAVLVFRFPAEMIGAWVRVMPLGFDRTQAERTRMVGGSGVVSNHTTGPRAVVTTTLPPGPSFRAVKVSFDVEILTALGRHVEAGLSLDRPARPRPGDISDTAPVVLRVSGTAPGLFVCETAGTQLTSGYNAIVERSGAFLAVDESSTPGDRYAASLAASFQSGDRVVLTTPPWTGQPGGDGLAKLCSSATPPTLLHKRRGNVDQLLEPSGTLPGHDDRTVVLSTASATTGAAILSGGDLRSDTHQILGPPGGIAGEPATAETHVAGVRLSGPAARLLHEAAMANCLPATTDLLSAAVGVPAPQPPPSTPTLWAAVLRTTRANVEGERSIDVASAATDYPLAADATERRAWLTAALLGAPLPSSTGADADAAFDRAAARRVMAAAVGLNEALPALRAAINSAQRFIYIEAPAFTAGILGAATTDLDLLDLVKQRLDSRPDVATLICVPQRSTAAFKHMRRFRTALQARVASDFHDTSSLQRRANRPVSPPGRNERAVVFSPLGAGRRELDIASTTVIVDDAVCFVGSTDLTRRGLTFDASTLVGIVDDVVSDHVSPTIRDFRTKLIADRLGEPRNAMPLDGRTVTAMIAEMLAQDVSRNIGLPLPPAEDVQRGIADPSTQPTRDLNILQTFLDPDGRSTGSVAIASYLAGLLTAVTSGSLASDSSQPSGCT